MSDIKPYNINANYPIPGVNQSSQGFRDNFLQIQKNFILSKNEIENLQSKTLQVTGDISGSVVWTNNQVLNLSVTLKDNLIFTGNKGIVVPSGDNSQRENTNAIIRFNNISGRLETYEGNQWYNLTGKNEYLSLNGGNISGPLTADSFNSPIISTENLTVQSVHSLRQSVYPFGRVGLINGTWNTIAEWSIDSISTISKSCSYTVFANVNNADLSRNWVVALHGIQCWNFNAANQLSISTPIVNSNSVGIGNPVVQMRTIEIGNRLQLQISAAETNSTTWEIAGNINVVYGTNGDIPFESIQI
jgi:hypothetical protein